MSQQKNASQLIKDFPGIYKLVQRTLPNGKVLKGHDVQGTAVFTKDGHSAINICVHNPAEENYHMLAYQSEYSLSEHEFTNALNAMASQFGKPTEPVQYTFNQPKKSSTVVVENGNPVIKNPAYYPLSEFIITSSGFTTHRAGNLKGVVDEWKKIG
ncbi:MAG TPA: hypothetical protein VGV92_08500 [Gammaproteobacteria bacterium]|nr:hypothetical protein [Gammaproteobacteria bacterium]